MSHSSSPASASGQCSRSRSAQPPSHPQCRHSQLSPPTCIRPALAELKLDYLRTSLSSTRIIARNTKECLYSIKVDANACSPTTTGLHRGSILDNQTRPGASSPFATFKGKSIYMNESNQPPSAATKVKKRDFLYSSRVFSQVNRFKVENIEYKLHKPAGGDDVTLIVASDSSKTPLCRFRSDQEDGNRSSTIDILPRAISSDQVTKPYALIHDGRPTLLLDMTLIAEKVYRANQRPRLNGQSVDGEDDYSSDLNGEA